VYLLLFRHQNILIVLQGMQVSSILSRP
jgi:hypothetical protein